MYIRLGETLSPPLTSLNGKSFSISSGTTATSACISPSTIKSGRRSLTRRAALAAFAASGCLVLPKLLNKVKSANVKIVVATGLHKPHTKAELKDLLGGEIFSNYRVISHNQNKNNLISMK